MLDGLVTAAVMMAKPACAGVNVTLASCLTGVPGADAQAAEFVVRLVALASGLAGAEHQAAWVAILRNQATIQFIGICDIDDIGQFVQAIAKRRLAQPIG